MPCNSILYRWNTRCKNNGRGAGSRGVYGLIWHSCSIHQYLVVNGAGFAWSTLCLHMAVARHKVIYLFDYCPASWHVPRDRWPLCPSSRRAVSLSSTKQLEGQLCGDPSYSLSLFLLLFTLSLSLLPPYHLLSIPRITPSSLDSHIFPALSIFSPHFLLICRCKLGQWPLQV